MHKQIAQRVIAPGPNGLKQKVVKPTMEQQKVIDELQKLADASKGSNSRSSGISGAETEQVVMINLADAKVEVDQTVRANYVHREMCVHGGLPEAFALSFAETSYPPLAPGSGIEKTAQHKKMRGLKNRCSKLILACTRMTICAPFLLLPAKRLNSMPEFDSICKIHY